MRIFSVSTDPRHQQSLSMFRIRTKGPAVLCLESATLGINAPPSLPLSPPYICICIYICICTTHSQHRALITHILHTATQRTPFRPTTLCPCLFLPTPLLVVWNCLNTVAHTCARCLLCPSQHRHERRERHACSSSDVQASAMLAAALSTRPVEILLSNRESAREH